MRIGVVGTGRIGLMHARNLAQTTVSHQRLEKFRMFEQGLAVGHDHRDESNADGVARDFDQLFLAPRAPISVGDVTARDLQSATGALEAAVGVDLLLHLAK